MQSSKPTVGAVSAHSLPLELIASLENTTNIILRINEMEYLRQVGSAAICSAKCSPETGLRAGR